jgi:hypothetical protein
MQNAERPRRILSAFCILHFAFAVAANAQSTFDVFGFLTGRSAYVKSIPSWTTGGFGKFDTGADAANDSALRSTAVAQLGADWKPTTWLTAHAHVLARTEPSGTEGRRFGVVEAYAEAHGERWRLRAGQFFLGTSRENVDSLWTSPYTITWSALNTWVGQEVRPVGADLQYSPNFYITIGATAFRDNDTMGTLPAERGWTLGNRLTLYDERVAVPPPQGSTKPFTRDLDGIWGHSERIRLSLPERAMLQITHLDNRAELVNRRGQVPWLTRFDHVGAQVGMTTDWTIAAEWLSGDTTIGFPGGTFTLDFDTVYLLGSWKRGNNRVSARVERFNTRSHERSAAPDQARERGNAWAVAWFRGNESARLGIEYLKVNAERFYPANVGGSMWTLELRYKF